MTSTSPTDGRRRRRVLQLMGAAILPLPFALHAQTYPGKPVELVVPASAGGGTDALARGFAEIVKKHLPQPLIVNDKPGASGVVGMSDVLNGKPDGYKVSVVIAELVILPHLNLAKFSYADFAPVARLNADPAAVTVRADAPWNTIEEFLAAAKARPDEIRVGNSGNGSIWHLAAAGLEGTPNLIAEANSLATIAANQDRVDPRASPQWAHQNIGPVTGLFGGTADADADGTEALALVLPAAGSHQATARRRARHRRRL